MTSSSYAQVSSCDHQLVNMRALATVAAVVMVLGLGIGTFAFLSQGQRAVPEAVWVASASAIAGTPIAVAVTIQDGMDRVLQRRQTGHPCSSLDPLSMGCPASTTLRPVTVYLVRDDLGALHAFIGEDPRNGCALNWRTDVHSGVFHDVCHGSLYDRRGVGVGGPSPWNLNELTSEVRDGDIYLYPTRFLIGGCHNCP